MKKFLINPLIILSLLFTSYSFADNPQPLPAAEAFAFSTAYEHPATLIVKWDVAPAYYLYRDKIHFKTPSQPKSLGPIAWPAPMDVVDPVLGNYRAYEGQVQIKIPLNLKTQKDLTLNVDYQGCSHDGFCYPPMKKVVHLSFPFAENLKATPLITVSEALTSSAQAALNAKIPQSLLSNQHTAENFIGSHSSFITILCFLGLGVLLAFTPCSLPMIPILSSIILGQKRRTTRRALSLSLVYVMGTALTYGLAGLLMAWVGSSIQVYFQSPWLIGGFSLLFFLLGLSMLGFSTLKIPAPLQKKIHKLLSQQKGGHYLGVFMMGCLSTLIVSPCITAPLVGVLAYISDTGNLWLGSAALFALGLGMGLPLIILGFSTGRYLPKSGPWMDVVTKIFGFLLIAMSVWMLGRIFPAGFITFLWSCLFIMATIYCFFFTEHLSRRAQKLGFIVGTLFMVYSLAIFFCISIEAYGPLAPIERLWLEAQPLRDPEGARLRLDFTDIQSMYQLDSFLRQAKIKHQPVVIDYFAEWCASCHVIEKTVLKNPEVRRALQGFMLLRANVTENNEFDKALLKRYDVIAPPTFVFINREGHEEMEHRIVGEIDAASFLAHAAAV